MANDYRNTKYCPAFEKMEQKKAKVVEMILADHPGEEDMHKFISQNDGPYKLQFMQVYNCKCGYGGVSLELIPKHLFEVDHFIYEKSPKFKGNKAAASHIDNLVLSCQLCNRSKNALNIPDEFQDKLSPDSETLTSIFVRDEQYYIQISEQQKGIPFIEQFHTRLKLGSEIHRLDYLLMSMIGLQSKHVGNQKVYHLLGQAIDILRLKRNIMG